MMMDLAVFKVVWKMIMISPKMEGKVQTVTVTKEDQFYTMVCKDANMVLNKCPQ